MNFQWYPGHMTKAKRMMQENIKLIDLVIELVDARVPMSSRNPDIDELGKNKARLILLNKADLADEKQTEEWIGYFRGKGYSAVKVNSRKVSMIATKELKISRIGIHKISLSPFTSTRVSPTEMDFISTYRAAMICISSSPRNKNSSKSVDRAIGINASIVYSIFSRKIGIKSAAVTITARDAIDSITFASITFPVILPTSSLSSRASVIALTPESMNPKSTTS